MDDIWDKLDGYTKSDYLNSSDDDESQEVYFKQTEHLYISTKKLSQTEVVDDESLCSEDVDTQAEEIQVEKQEKKLSLHESLLDEMKNSDLHCNSETRNVQEKIDEMSVEKSQQKDEPSEMQHKAQVISKSARMSATDVLSTITTSETIDHEESGHMDEYYDRIRSTNTEGDGDDPPEDSCENERKSDVDLPNIHPLSTTLNTGVMKSKANVARQGSMKARRKPTLMKRKSWTPGMDEMNIPEQDEVIVEDAEDVEELPTGSFTPSDSSSEEEKEVVKPHLRSGVALPGLGDALKIQMTRSELKRPTALNLVKTAKDVKENEVSREVKLETLPSKPDWMKEMEERKKKAPQRRHKTLPARCSELDTLFEQRKQVQSTESLDPRTNEGAAPEGPFVARDTSRSKNLPGEDIDPELQKMFERRKNLKPLETEDGTSHGTGIDVKEMEKPTNFHGDNIDLELNKMFERRKNLKPMEVDNNSSAERAVVKEAEKPKTFHGDQVDLELNKMFERRKNLQPVDREASNSEEEDQMFKPRNIHLQNSQATELDKIFEKRKQLRPVGGVRSSTPESRFHESPTVVNPPADLRQTSGIVRARFHDAKLEPLPSRGEVKVATVAEVEVRTAREVEEYRRPNLSKKEIETTGAPVAQFVFDGRGASHATVGRIPVGSQSGNSKLSRPPTALEQHNASSHTPEAQVDGRGPTRGTVDRSPAGVQSGNFKPPHPPTALEQGNRRRETPEAAEDVFNGRGVSHVSRIPSAGNQRSSGRLDAIGHQRRSPEERNAGQGAQVAQFVFDGSAAASHATVGRIPLGVNQRPTVSQDHVAAKTSPMPSRIDNRDGHVMATRGNVVKAHDVNTNQVVISSTSKSDTRNFIEQLSRKPGGKPHGDVSQGKSVPKPCMEDRNNVPSKITPPANSKNEKGRQKPYTDMEHPLPNKYHHGEPRPHLYEGNTPIHQSHSTSLPPQEFLPRNLPPINTQYSSNPPSHSSNIRPLLAHSLSHPQNSTSQFQNHPPLIAKMSTPQLSYSPPIEHSPRAPTEGRVTSPRSARVREVKSPVREMDPDLNGGKVDSNLSNGNETNIRTYANVSDSSRLHKVTSPAELWGNPPGKNESDILRSKIAEGRVESQIPPRDLCNGTKQGVRVRNVELSTNVDRNSDSNGLHHEETGQRMSRVRSPDRSDDQRIRRVQNLDRSGDQKVKSHENPDRLSDEWTSRVQRPDRSDDQRIRRVLNTDKSGDQQINRVRSPDRSDDQKIRIIQNPGPSGNQKLDRVRSPDRSNDQKINMIRNPDRSDNRRINRIRSPDRSDDQKINRIRSPDRSGDQKISRIRSPDRSGDQKISRIRSPDRSGDQKLRDGKALEERVSYQSPVAEERGTDNRLQVKTQFNSKQNTIDPITNGKHNNREFENRTRGITSPLKSSSAHNTLLNRESVERPKHVTVTVKSLSESPVYVRSPVGRVRSCDRDNMVCSNGEGVVNDLENVRERQGVKTFKGILDVQSPGSPAIPKWKQELQEKKRLQKEKQLGSITPTMRQNDNIQHEQSGNDLSEWQKRLQGIRKTWGTEESEDPNRDIEKTSPVDHMSRPDVDEENNAPGFLKELQQKKMKQSLKDEKQDTETYV